MSLEKLEQEIGYKFLNKELLQEAISHPSCKQYNKSHINYERLELLGDTLIGFIIVDILLLKFKSYNEGELAKLKAYLVSKTIICNIAQSLNLGHYLIMTKGEEKYGGRTNNNNLENAMEALIAAIYLDTREIKHVYKIVKNLWSKYLNNDNLETIDPKTTLQQLSQAKYQKLPEYILIDKKGSDHMPNFTVCVKVKNISTKASGTSIKEAEKKAAQTMLTDFKNILFPT